VGGTLVALELEKPYPENYKATVQTIRMFVDEIGTCTIMLRKHSVVPQSKILTKRYKVSDTLKVSDT